MINRIDLQAEKYIINRFVSIPKLFDSLGIDYRVDGNMFCPFHYNVNTPSAHLYHDDTGYRIWCFSEGRMYGAWDVYKTYMKNIDTNKLAILILNQFSEEQQNRILLDIGAEKEPETLAYEKDLKDFKFSKINITELLQKIADSYIDN